MAADDLPKIDVSDHLDEEQLDEIRGALAAKIDEPAMMIVGIVEPASQEER